MMTSHQYIRVGHKNYPGPRGRSPGHAVPQPVPHAVPYAAPQPQPTGAVQSTDLTRLQEKAGRRQGAGFDSAWEAAPAPYSARRSGRVCDGTVVRQVGVVPQGAADSQNPADGKILQRQGRSARPVERRIYCTDELLADWKGRGSLTAARGKVPSGSGQQ